VPTVFDVVEHHAKAWARHYERAAPVRATGHLWAIHVYRAMSTNDTRHFANLLRWGPVQRRGVVWITEVGSPLTDGSGTMVAGGEQTQADRLAALFNSTVYKSNLRVIKRFYYYLRAGPDGSAAQSRQVPRGFLGGARHYPRGDGVKIPFCPLRRTLREAARERLFKFKGSSSFDPPWGSQRPLFS
jgi:hypothetical protein